jgi:hypothetical protein
MQPDTELEEALGTLAGGNGKPTAGGFDPMASAAIIAEATRRLPRMQPKDLEMGLDDWVERLGGQSPEETLHSIVETIRLIEPVCDDPGAEVKAALQRAGLIPEERQQGPFIDWTAFWQAEHAEEEWVYQDVLAKGRGHAIYAMHKAGKSLLTLYVAAHIATTSKDVAVVYLDYEMTESDLHDRLDDMGYGADTDFSRLRYALLPTLPPLDSAAGADALDALLDGVEKDLPGAHLVVIIDTISRAVAGEENDADTFRAFYNHTGIRLKRRGATWVRLDHAGKSKEQGQRGSSGKGDDVDVVWKLIRTEHGIQLKRELSRMGWVPELVTFKESEAPLQFLRLADDWPLGTADLARELDRLDVPVGCAVRTACQALKENGTGRRQVLVRAALRWRRETQEQGTLG